MQIGKSNISERQYPVGTLVKAGNVMKILTSCLDEQVSALHCNFFQGFQAILNKAWTDYIHALCPFPAELFEGYRGVGA